MFGSAWKRWNWLDDGLIPAAATLMYVSWVYPLFALFFRDFIEPNKKYRKPEDEERPWFESLLKKLDDYAGDDENELQAMVFDTAREHGTEPKLVFRAIYEVLLGQERGPRFGTFVKLVGKKKAVEMISEALA